MRSSRPTGVSVLAVVEFVGGILALIAGFELVAEVGGYAAAGFASGSTFYALGALELVLGLLSLVVGYGLWTGKGWAWPVALAFNIAGIIIAVGVVAFLPLFAAGSAISIVIALIVLYYLFRPHVKQFFGRGQVPQSPAPQPRSPPQ